MTVSKTTDDDSLLLIVGGDSDPNTRRIVDQAHLRNLRYEFWNTDRPDAHQIAWDFETPHIDLGDQRWNPTSVYLRYNVFGGDPVVNQSAFNTIQAYVLAWPSIRLLNREVMTDANNKSRNLRIAKEIGFDIPETTVLADLTPLASMPDSENQIIKPLDGGGHALSVKDVQDDPVKLAGLGPQFVQSRMLGENMRVFSIGGKLSAFHLGTDCLDYREDDGVTVESIDVPNSLFAPIEELVRATQFDYCALDFRFRNGWNEPVFLEINSFPMFVRFDDACENQLADATLDFLVSACTPCSQR